MSLLAIHTQKLVQCLKTDKKEERDEYREDGWRVSQSVDIFDCFLGNVSGTSSSVRKFLYHSLFVLKDCCV